MNKPPLPTDNSSLVNAPGKSPFEAAVEAITELAPRQLGSSLVIQDYDGLPVESEWLKQLPDSDISYINSITHFQNSALVVFNNVATEDAKIIRSNPDVYESKNLAHVQEQLAPITKILFPNWGYYAAALREIYKAVSKGNKAGQRLKNVPLKKESIVGWNEIYTLGQSMIFDSAKHFPVILKEFLPNAPDYFKKNIHMLYFRAYGKQAPTLFGFPKDNMKEGCPVHFTQENIAYALQNLYQRQDIYDVLVQGTQEQAVHNLLLQFVSLVYEFNNSLGQMHTAMEMGPRPNWSSFRNFQIVRHQLFLMTSLLSKTVFWQQLLSRPLPSPVSYNQLDVSAAVQNAMPPQA